MLFARINPKKHLKLLLFFTLIFGIYLGFKTDSTNAESLSVSLQVGSTSVTFSGYTSPSALVIIKEDGNTIGTTTSLSDGTWSKNVSVAVPDQHTYTLSATDQESRQSAVVSYTLSVAGNTTTTIDNIVLPPTTSISGVILAGESYPGATITITSSAGDSMTTTVGTSGTWSYDLSSLSTSGSQTIKATATVGSYLSLDSIGITFNAPGPSPSPTVSASTTPSTQIEPSPLLHIERESAREMSPNAKPSGRPFFVPLYDLNHDGTINLGELVDVVKQWLLRNLPCDLNEDGFCNLIDLSILLYYIGR